MASGTPSRDIRGLGPGRIGPQRPSLGQLAAVFLRIGNLTFGSAAATTARLRDELVERNGWLGEAQCALCYIVARVAPGTNLLAFYTAAAWYIRGWPGAIVALVSGTVPASALVVLFTYGYDRWHEHPVGGAFISGAMAAVVGIIAAGAWLIAQPQIRPRGWFRALVLIIGAIALAEFTRIPPIPIMLIGGVVGYAWREP